MNAPSRLSLVPAIALLASALALSCAGAPFRGASPAGAAPRGEATVDAEKASPGTAGAAAAPSLDRAAATETGATGGTKDAAPSGGAPAAAPKPAERDESAKKAEGSAEESASGRTSAPGMTKALGDVSGAPAPSAERSVPAESGLKAGYADDNEQFNYFLSFLDQHKDEVDSYPLNVQERITLKVLDADGRPVADADLSVKAGGKKVASGRTYADGLFRLFPLEYQDASTYRVDVSYGKLSAFADIARNGPREVEIRLEGKRSPPSPLPLDILFVLDTTGSMGEEIDRLKDNIEIIRANVAAVTPKPLVRFGMVLYRDKGDEYVTKRVPFTDKLESFQAELDKVEADGGGDTPEDLQSALKDAVAGMDWNRDGLRLAFVVTDAPPHLDYGQTYTYASAAREAKAKGIKVYTVGAGGLDISGEYVLRQLSQYTDARYLFLTYGEKGESEGGAVASVSHHTGSNWTADKLESIIIRFAREELAWQSDSPLAPDEPYFDAQKVADEAREATVEKLFTEALSNMVDYSTIKLGADSRVVILPLAGDAALGSQAEYFSQHLLLSALSSKPFTVLERKDLQSILKEQELQLSGLVDEKTAVKVGGLLGADYLVSGQLFDKGDRYEVFLQLMRVQTGEILSVTKAKLAKDLGL